MNIHITKSSATEETELAAFDACLQDCGIADQNLIYLSSIIPPDTNIVLEKPNYDEGHFGNKLYVVMAQQRESRRHRQAWAGIGWVKDSVTGKGLFVEHEGESEDQVEKDIYKTLTSMMERRPNPNGWSEIEMVVQGAVCGDKPVCAMVVAAYQSEDWNS
jgi:arginine decarboxylase